MNKGKLLWSEDDATVSCEGHESLCNAWLRLFGERLDLGKRIEFEDCGDVEWNKMPNGKIIQHSYSGNNAIYEAANE